MSDQEDRTEQGSSSSHPPALPPSSPETALPRDDATALGHAPDPASLVAPSLDAPSLDAPSLDAPSLDAPSQPPPPSPSGGPDRSRAGGFRWFTFVLFATLVLVAVLGSRATRSHPTAPQTFQHVTDGPPPVLLPTGKLENAYEFAREATVRIDERCTTVHGEATLGMGTGFFVSADGLVLTAYHVVDTASRPTGCAPRFVAVTPQHSEYDLALVGFDAYMDLAMLQASVDRSMPFMRPAARAPTPGSPVVAIGNSRNDFLQPRAGEVTRLGVHAGRADFADNTIELTNSLAPGDSGGPVINERGEVVGVVSYISYNPGAMSSDAFMPPFLRGVALPRRFASYAVPVFDDAALFSALAAGEQRDVPVVGFSWRQGMDYDPVASDVYLGRRPGTIVVTVQPGGPADVAGLRSLKERSVTNPEGVVTRRVEADVIVAVDGRATPGFYDLLDEIRDMKIGQTVTLTVQRGNATFRVPLTLGAKRAVFSSN